LDVNILNGASVIAHIKEVSRCYVRVAREYWTPNTRSVWSLALLTWGCMGASLLFSYFLCFLQNSEIQIQVIILAMEVGGWDLSKQKSNYDKAWRIGGGQQQPVQVRMA
jgi:hypothetical protein